MKEPKMHEKGSSEAFNTGRLSKIASEYGISSLKFVSSPEKGIITENAVLEDDLGNRYFVKFYRDEKTEKYTSTYRAAELVAQNREIPVSLPLLSSDGSYISSLEGRSLALFPHVAHQIGPLENEEEDNTLTRSIAINLGRIHATALPNSETAVLPIERWQPSSIASRRDELDRLKEHISSLPEKTDFDLLALKSVVTKSELLKQLPQRPVTQIESGICHGDYHGHNILHNSDMEVVAIVDWDNAGLAEPYIDFLQTFITNVIGKRFDSYQTERRGNAQIFVKSYIEGLGTNIDIERLKDAYYILMHERIGTSWPLRNHYDDNKTKNDDRVGPVLERSITYAGRYDEILNFILSVVAEVNLEGRS